MRVSKRLRERTRTRSAEAAEDVTQEAFLRVLKRASRYTPQGKFSVRLLTITANLCKDYRKQQRRRAGTSLDALRETEAEIVQKLRSWLQRPPLLAP